MDGKVSVLTFLVGAVEHPLHYSPQCFRAPVFRRGCRKHAENFVFYLKMNKRLDLPSDLSHVSRVCSCKLSLALLPAKPSAVCQINVFKELRNPSTVLCCQLVQSQWKKLLVHRMSYTTA